VAHHQLLAHARATAVLRDSPGARVGTTLAVTSIEPASDSDDDRAAAEFADAAQNGTFLDPLFGRGYPDASLEIFPPPPIRNGDLEEIAAPLDFLGVNYYTRMVVTASPSSQMKFAPVRTEGPRTAMGWEVYPDGLRKVLAGIAADYSPPALYVTENGAAFEDPEPRHGRVEDPLRVDYLRRHLAAVAGAMEDGAPVKGYFCWSLMDNFEWSFGFSKRFGIVYVDFNTQDRVVKDSGRFYAEVARRCSIPEAEQE